jgi:acylphosphatase
MVTTVHIKIHGRVQGVGFRYYAEEAALTLGLTGWVCNLPDESVAVLAEGDKERLDSFVAIINRGPTFGRVEDIDLEWKERESRAFNDFLITDGPS